MTAEHILVVDDDAGLAATVGASLRRSGFSCEISRNSPTPCNVSPTVLDLILCFWTSF